MVTPPQHALTRFRTSAPRHLTPILLAATLLLASCGSKPTQPLSPPAPVTDVDGNVYQTVRIGNQVWMAENLKVLHYRNGDSIFNITSPSVWKTTVNGAYCNYNNATSNVAVYGRLYNWLAATDSRQIAPVGWHVPSDAEWQTLIDYLGGFSVAAGPLKEAGLAHWNSPNTGATDSSGFTALPAEFRNWDGTWTTTLGNDAFFWSATQSDSTNAWDRRIFYSITAVEHSAWDKHNGMSIRCVKDQ